MLNDIAITNGFYSPEESQVVRSVFNELLSQVDNFPRKMIDTPHDERLRPFILKALEKIKAVSGVEELYIAEYLINIYFPGFSMGVHTDIEDGKGHFAVSAVTYFNSDYEGGEIIFPKLPLSHKPQEGDIAIFPSSDDRFDHGVSLLTSGVRYVMPIWTTQDRTKANKFIHQEK